MLLCVHKFTSKTLCNDQHCVWGEGGPIFAIIINALKTAFQQCRNYMPFAKSPQILFPRL